jgi:hypothetical protein
MHPFEEYLEAHNLEALQVSVIGKVRYMFVYNATKGFPISAESAKHIRQAVFTITKVPYAGPLTLIASEPVEDAPTIPIKRIPRCNFN